MTLSCYVVVPNRNRFASTLLGKVGWRDVTLIVTDIQRYHALTILSEKNNDENEKTEAWHSG